MSTLKIVAGLASIDDYEALCRAGADEVFLGYVPSEYQRTFGIYSPLNRREVIYTNVQAGSMSELMILKRMEDKLKVKPVIAINALFFSEEQRNFIKETLYGLKEHGFKDYIVSDEKLVFDFSKDSDINIHLSGEYGELNHRILERVPASRIIFPRQTTVSEMEKMIRQDKENNRFREYEAFILNERCQFTGAYCNSRHCDEFEHMCLLEYRVSPKVPIDKIKTETGAFAETGCGLCKLWELKRIGITHLKLVSRGQACEDTIRDIMNLKRAINIAENSDTPEEYIKEMKKTLFSDGCPDNCYY